MIDPVGPVQEVTHQRTAPDPGSGWRRAWGEVLQDIEGDIVTAEELLRNLHDGEADVPPEFQASQDWVEPSLQGPVPLEFAQRARRLLERQLDVSERLAEALVQVRAQRRALGKMDRPERLPVFFDKPL